MIALSACDGNEEAADDETNNEANEAIEQVEDSPESDPESEVAYTYPLTGIEADKEMDHRAFGVMIENSISARPQTGLYQADVVYEVLSEGQITRLLAFYHSEQPERIGPVRSARDYYIFLNNGYDAMYASAGGSPGAFDLIESGEVDYISGLDFDGRFFSRASDRLAPHNMYTAYDDLVEAADYLNLERDDRKPPELPFSDEVELTSAEAQVVDINYSSSTNNVRFDYDETIGGYIRSVGGDRMYDFVTDDPVAPKNLFIVEANHQVIDDQGRRDIDIESGGKAYLIHEGVMIEAEWENVDGVLLPFKNGEPLEFVPGQTWINLVESLESDVSFSEDHN